MKPDLDKVIDFCQFLLDFQAIERVVSLPTRQVNENDAEHSYSLTMMAWYLGRDLPDLNMDLVIKYSLVHDLVEVYAGDTFIYSKDQAHLDSKADREAAALAEIKKRYPDFSDLTTMIEDYETQQDPESQFVYALDKVMPVIFIYLSGGQSWHAHGISLKQLLDHKLGRVERSPLAAELMSQLARKLEQQPELFPNAN